MDTAYLLDSKNKLFTKECFQFQTFSTAVKLILEKLLRQLLKLSNILQTLWQMQQVFCPDTQGSNSKYHQVE
jgi:hypothetical protein